MPSKQQQINDLKAQNEAMAAKLEQQGKPDAEPVPQEEFTPRLYWARAKKYRIANYVPEKKTSGNIDQREISIQFEEHIRLAHTLHEVEYIEGHKGFGIECRRVASMEEAAGLTFKQDLERGQARAKPITTAVMDDVERPEEREKAVTEAGLG